MNRGGLLAIRLDTPLGQLMSSPDIYLRDSPASEVQNHILIIFFICPYSTLKFK